MVADGLPDRLAARSPDRLPAGIIGSGTRHTVEPLTGEKRRKTAETGGTRAGKNKPDILGGKRRKQAEERGKENGREPLPRSNGCGRSPELPNR